MKKLLLFSLLLTNTLCAQHAMFHAHNVNGVVCPSQPSVITGTTPVCQTQSGVAYSVTNVVGVTYTWTYSGTGLTVATGQGSNSITANFSGTATTGTLTVTPSNSCGTGTARTFSITVNPVPSQPSTITGNTGVCANLSSEYYYVTNVSGVTYTWSYSGTGLTITSGQGTSGIYVDFSGSPTSGTLTCTPSNACGSGSARNLALTVTSCSGPPAQPSAISSFFGCGTTASPGTDCDKYYRVDEVYCGGITYAWTVPAGWTILSGQGTRQINCDVGGNGTITVTPSNACGTGTAQTVAVTPFSSSYVFPTNNPAGNLFLFSNYDGGYLTINVDINIPNIKIGVVSYEASQITITGTYAANVTSVYWAGYGATNCHCSPCIGSTTITGAPGTTSILPASSLSNSCGSSSITCSYTCNVSGCGGCNTPDQIVHFFYNNIFSGSTFNSFTTLYGCWSGSGYNLSTTGTCTY